jgi:hypothetical protein
MEMDQYLQQAIGRELLASELDLNERQMNLVLDAVMKAHDGLVKRLEYGVFNVDSHLFGPDQAWQLDVIRTFGNDDVSAQAWADDMNKTRAQHNLVERMGRLGVRVRHYVLLHDWRKIDG